MTLFFDFDGTLSDPSKRYYLVHCAALGGVKPILSKEEYWECKRAAMSEADILKQYYGGPIDSYDDMRSKLIEAPEYLVSDTLYPGAKETLKTLHATHTLMLASLRRQQENLLDELTRLSIHDLFARILTAHSYTDHTAVKRQLLQENAQPSDWIIGDTEADINAGKQAGLTTVAVLAGIRSEDYLRALHPDHVISDITKLPDLI